MTEARGWAQAHRWVIIVVLVGLLVVGLASFRYAKRDKEANEKADQLVTKLEDAGLPVPASRETITNVLGADGGAICADPGSALRKAIADSQLVNGAASVGQRPIIGEVDLVSGAVLVLEVYCPDKVAAFRDSVEGYEFDDVGNN
ncbi:MAG: hypothetical protein WBA97_05990 [Actinophytocola sp.]|uniref:hypothetical protein n=1 Tax=Actinophytocola sp. TaxID=1872138 RepID=UPI003C70DBC4